MNQLQIDINTCTRCKKCEKDCPSLAITIDNYSISSDCISCGHCVAICQTQSIQFQNVPVTPLVPHTISPENFYHLSTNTRTCRKFADKPIEQEVLQALLENMKQYPSASNTRSVEVLAIVNKDIIRTLNDMAAHTMLKTFSFFSLPIIRTIIRIVASKQEIEKIRYYKQVFSKKISMGMQNITFEAPLVLIFHGKKQASGMLQTDADIWATYTSLYASTFGLGTCFNGFIVKALKKNKQLKKRLGIPAENHVYISLLVGHPHVTYYNETSRTAPLYSIVN